MTEDAYEARLLAFVGHALGEPSHSQDPVNVPMIRHWVEALGLTNPVHLDPVAARATGRPDVVAPAAMTQAFVMRGYAATLRRSSDTGPFQKLVDLFDEGGYTSVVATDSDFVFERELVPGDEVSCEEVVVDISPEKSTALGIGRFVTTCKTYRDGQGLAVATQTWRTLRFRSKDSAAAAGSAPVTLRPRPAINLDNEFWFEAARERRLVIQRCRSCEVLRHPPGPCCAACGSFDWDTVEASGAAKLYSWVVAHHPKHPAFDFPMLVGLVELAEGTRLIANLVGIDAERLVAGLDLELDWLEADTDLTLPVFGPVATGNSKGED